MSTVGHGDLYERVAASADSIAPLRDEVVAYAATRGAPAERCQDIALAVSEAVSNVVMHAYVDRDGDGLVSVHATMHQRSLDVVVCDEGVGMPAGGAIPRLGIGLTLLERVTDRLQLEDATPGLRLRMTFAIA